MPTNVFLENDDEDRRLEAHLFTTSTTTSNNSNFRSLHRS
jgi:hypothetical protein